MFLKTTLARILFVAFALLSCIPSFATGPQARITQPIDPTNAVRITGTVHAKVRESADAGAAESSLIVNRVVISFKPTEAQAKDLAALLEQQQDPTSPNYHKWLTPEEYGARFGLAASDFARIQAWLKSQGLTVVDAPSSRTYIAFTATSAQLARSFGVQMHRYLLNGESHYSNSNDPQIPAALKPVVLGVHGLNDFRPAARTTNVRRVNPKFTSNISGNHFVTPEDFTTIYNLQSLYNSGLDGTGQSIAIMGQTALTLTDVTTFRSLSGLPTNDPQTILIPGTKDPGVRSADIQEALLDVEWAGAVAKNATIKYYYANNVMSALEYAVSNNVAPVLSISYGDCEANWSASEISSVTALGQQANAQGQTILAASGDSGAADCDFNVSTASHGLAVDLPASMPTVTGMGGTTFNEGSATFWNASNSSSNGSAISYIPEVAWNDTTFEIANGGTTSASGGGQSVLFSKPSWQVGTGVPSADARFVPDISFNASPDHDGYLICAQSQCVDGFRAADTTLTVVGGTSVAAPAFAGVVALLNQRTASSQGNVNPTLYTLAASNADAFHDITSGDNKVPCTSGTTDCTNTTSIGFAAGTGYDEVTGLGTLNISTLVSSWPNAAAPADFQIVAASSSMTIARSSSNSASQTITLSALNGFNGKADLSCSVASTLAGVTCSLSPTSVTGAGTSTLTITAPVTTASNLSSPMPRPRLPLTFALSFVGGTILSGALLNRKVAIVLGAVLLLGLVLSLTACGGSSSNTSTPARTTTTPTPLSGTVTVQATSGSLSHSVSIAVTVN